MSKRKISVEKSRLVVGERWDSSIASFITNREAKNLSELTIEWYRLNLNLFADYCRDRKIDGPSRCDEELMVQYVLHLQNARGDTATTVNGHLRSLRAFFRYLSDGGYIEQTVKVQLVKIDQKLVQGFSEADVAKLIERPSLKDIGFVGYRDWMMVCTFIGLGMRLSSLINMQIGDIDLRERSVRLRKTKSRKEQLLPLPTSLHRDMADYIQALRDMGSQDNDYLFPSAFGQQLKPRSLQNRIIKYCEERGVSQDIRWSPHTLRHTMARLAVVNGTDVATLQKVLGQSSLAVTQQYINLLASDLKKTFVSPLDVLSRVSQHGRKALQMHPIK